MRDSNNPIISRDIQESSTIAVQNAVHQSKNSSSLTVSATETHYPDLSEVVNAWDTLSHDIRQAILELVRHH